MLSFQRYLHLHQYWNGGEGGTSCRDPKFRALEFGVVTNKYHIHHYKSDDINNNDKNFRALLLNLNLVEIKLLPTIKGLKLNISDKILNNAI